ncbi:MAG: hypothetical protein ACAH80_03905 [Alphaproteobacteria bacterium]
MKIWSDIKSKLSSFSQKFKAGRTPLMAIVIMSFLAGYNIVLSYDSQCQGQAVLPPAPPIFVSPGFCLGFPPACPLYLCDNPSMSSTAQTAIQTAFDLLIENLASVLPPTIIMATSSTSPYGLTTPSSQTYLGLEGFLGGMIDYMMAALLGNLNQFELNLIDWWDTMFWYNLKPALMAMVDQLNTATVQQNHDFQAGMDAYIQNKQNLANMADDKKNSNQLKPPENACIAATNTGGMGMQAGFATGMRGAWEDEATQAASNKQGVPSQQSSSKHINSEGDVFNRLFCDPTDNQGSNNCAATSDPNYYNADTQVTKRLYNALTIPVNDNSAGKMVTAGGGPPRQKDAEMVKQLLNNTMGDPTGDPIPIESFRTPQGHERWMDRRAYLARYAAIRSVPQLIVSWRMPGTRQDPTNPTTNWVEQLRRDANIPLAEIAANPSYREVMHAMTIDRFNSQKYAANLIGNEGEIDMEKLTLSTFYLMELRDYFELLERQALALAVQVSLLAEDAPLPEVETLKSQE